MNSKMIQPLSAVAQLMVLLAMLAAASVAVSAQIDGAANGNLALISNGEKAFGYSTYSMLWSSVELEGVRLASETSPSLGFILTTEKLFAYNAVSGGWFKANYTGPPCGYDVNGAAIIFWTENAAYGISTVWARWARKSLKREETPLDGASAGNFGLLWTSHNAYAYNGSSGQWMSKQLGSPPVGGIASDGLGLVWTNLEAYAFEPSPGAWMHLDLMGYPMGMSADGSGDVALIWSSNAALVYSSQSREWFTFPCYIDAACAAGDIALVWNEEMAYSFDVNLGTWSAVPIGAREPAGLVEPAPGGASFSVGPNPCAAGPLAFRLPAGNKWEISVVDLEGRTIRTMEMPAASHARTVEWDWRDDQGRPIPAGTYWVRATSETRREARRVIRLQ